MLAAGMGNPFAFPLIWPAKPKCLYSFKGKIQLQRVLEDVRALGLEEKTRIVIGYRGERIREFIRKSDFKVELVENPRYRESAIYSVLTGIEGVDEDVLLMFADERIKLESLRRLIQTDTGLGFLMSKDFLYYCSIVLKVGKEKLDLFRDQRYLSDEFLADARRFLCDDSGRPLGKVLPPPAGIYLRSGWALDFMIIDIIRRVCKLNKATDPIGGGERDFSPVPFDESAEYMGDLDRFWQTDEYRNSAFVRFVFHLEVAVRLVERSVTILKHPVRTLRSLRNRLRRRKSS